MSDFTAKVQFTLDPEFIKLQRDLQLRQAQLAWDPFWFRPTYVIRCRNC